MIPCGLKDKTRRDSGSYHPFCLLPSPESINHFWHVAGKQLPTTVLLWSTGSHLLTLLLLFVSKRDKGTDVSNMPTVGKLCSEHYGKPVQRHITPAAHGRQLSPFPKTPHTVCSRRVGICNAQAILWTNLCSRLSPAVRGDPLQPCSRVTEVHSSAPPQKLPLTPCTSLISGPQCCA